MAVNERAGVESARDAASDESLIAEIPPAMLEKSKRDSRTLLLVMVGLTLICTNAMGGHSAGRLVADLGTVFFSIGALVSIFKYPILLRGELQYRCRHGKWRWER